MIYGIISFSDFNGNLEAFVDTLAKANELLKARGIAAPVQLSNNIETALQSENDGIPRDANGKPFPRYEDGSFVQLDKNGLPIIRRDFGSPLVNLWCTIKGFKRFRCQSGKTREESAFHYLRFYLKKGDFGKYEAGFLRMLSKGLVTLTLASDCIDATLEGNPGTLAGIAEDNDEDEPTMAMEESADDDDGNGAY